MTAAELIALLQQVPAEAELRLSPSDYFPGLEVVEGPVLWFPERPSVEDVADGRVTWQALGVPEAPC